MGGLERERTEKAKRTDWMIFQHFNLLMQKSVLENVCFPMYIQGKKKKEAREKAEELLEIVGLKESKCISFSIIRWSKTESCNCKSTCNIA